MYQFRPFFSHSKMIYFFVIFSRLAQMPLKTRTKRKNINIKSLFDWGRLFYSSGSNNNNIKASSEFTWEYLQLIRSLSIFWTFKIISILFTWMGENLHDVIIWATQYVRISAEMEWINVFLYHKHIPFCLIFITIKSYVRNKVHFNWIKASV